MKVEEGLIEEKKATISGNENLKNTYGVAFSGEDTLVAGDNGLVYVFRKDKVADSKFKVSNSAASCLGMIQREGKEQMLSIGEEGKIAFWDG